MFAVAVCSSFSASALADQFDTQIAALRGQANTQQATADQFAAQAQDYQTRVNQLDAQVALLRTQINLNQVEHDKIVGEITTNETKLATEKSVLGANLKSMYLNSSVTPIEMIASSTNFSDYFNQQQYEDSIKNKIQAAMTDILAIQKSLADQKTQVEVILNEEQIQNVQLTDATNEANSLLATAAQSAAAANAQVKASNAQITSLKSQQAAILAAQSRSFGGSIPGASSGSGGACDNGHGNGGYPSSWCNAGQDTIQTRWGQNRECVSWAGWRRAQLGHDYGNLGNANTWDNYAPAGTVHSSPEIGAVAQTDRGPYGHVAVVEAIQGSNVIVSEMNYDDYGHFRYGTYPTSFFENYIY